MAQPSPMNGGDGTYSYAKNSTKQRNAASVVMDGVKQALIDNLDVEKLCGSNTRFVIADLGCSVGPNTFFAMQTLIEAVEHKYHKQGHDSKKLEFQVLFNDQTANDFNTLFASLPHPRNYFAAGVPGSFHGRLFPSSSIHIVYSAYAMHWLSKVPEALLVKDSSAWNAGKISFVGASDAVKKAYLDQFERDMEVLLRARAEEIAAGGMIVILMAGVPDEELGHDRGSISPFFESILMDMVKERLVEQEQVDLFNTATIRPCMKYMERVIEKNGCFDIVKMELADLKPSNGDAEVDPVSVLMQLRAASEGSIAAHFGNEFTDQFFSRITDQKLNFTEFLHSHQAAFQLCVVLKRKSY